MFSFFFFNDTATTEIYTLSLHDALPIYWLLLVLAALVGALPSMPAMVRARWTVLLRGTPQLQTAYALEAVLDDVCFIVGPPLSVRSEERRVGKECRSRWSPYH